MEQLIKQEVQTKMNFAIEQAQRLDAEITEMYKAANCADNKIAIFIPETNEVVYIENEQLNEELKCVRNMLQQKLISRKRKIANKIADITKGY